MASEPSQSEMWRPSTAWSLRVLFPELRRLRAQMLEDAEAARLNGDEATYVRLLSGVDDATMSAFKDMYKRDGGSHTNSQVLETQLFDTCEAA